MSFIETPRLMIRAWMASDGPNLASIYGNSPEQAGGVIREMNEEYERLGYGVWPVVLKSSSALIGACGLREVTQISQIELTAAFLRDEWGHGYAHEASSAVLGFGFQELNLGEIVGLVDRENARGIALINRLEMHYDRVIRARHRDLMRYSKRRT